MTSREWNTGVATGLLRVVVGSGLIRWRRPLARAIGGAAPDDSVVPLLFGFFGVRDVTIGVVTLAATRPDGDVSRAVTWQGIADAVDAALIGAVASTGRMPRPRAIGSIVVAIGSAFSGFATAHQLRRATTT